MMSMPAGKLSLIGALEPEWLDRYQPLISETDAGHVIPHKVRCHLFRFGDRYVIGSTEAVRQWYYGSNITAGELLRYVGVQAEPSVSGKISSGRLVGHYAGRASSNDAPQDGLGFDVIDDEVYPEGFICRMMSAPTCLFKSQTFHDQHPLSGGEWDGFSVAHRDYDPSDRHLEITRRVTDDYRLMDPEPGAFLGIRMLQEFHKPHPYLSRLGAGDTQVLNDPLAISTWYPMTLDEAFADIDGVEEWDWAFGVNLTSTYTWADARGRIGAKVGIGSMAGVTQSFGMDDAGFMYPRPMGTDSQKDRIVRDLGIPLCEHLLAWDFVSMFDVPVATDQLLIDFHKDDFAHRYTTGPCCNNLFIRNGTLLFGCDGEVVYKWARANEIANLESDNPKDVDKMAGFVAFCDATRRSHHVMGIVAEDDASVNDLKLVRYLADRNEDYLSEEIDGEKISTRRNRLNGRKSIFVHRFADEHYEYIGVPKDGTSLSTFLADADRQAFKVRIGEQVTAANLDGYFVRNEILTKIEMNDQLIEIELVQEYPEGTVEVWYGDTYLPDGRAPTIAEIEKEGGITFITLKVASDVMDAMIGAFHRRIIRGTAVEEVAPEALVHEWCRDLSLPYDFISHEGYVASADLFAGTNEIMDICFMAPSSPAFGDAERSGWFLEQSSSGRMIDWIEQFLEPSLMIEKMLNPSLTTALKRTPEFR
jgi:hypothetical protein